MALHALKESKIPGTICRLSPPSSPSRRVSQAVTRPAFKPKLLAALDAELSTVLGTQAAPSKRNTNASNMQSANANSRAVSKPIHPFFITTGEALPSEIPDFAPIPKTTILKSNGKSVPAKAAAASEKLQDASRSEVWAKTVAAAEQVNPVLPLFSYTDYNPGPAVVYTRHEEEANDLVQTLKGPLGFDLEWRVFMRRNMPITERRTALVQLADERMILLVHVSAMNRFPQKVKEVIESRTFVKTGANIRNDGQKLFRDFGIKAAGLVELGAFAHQADPAFHTVYKRSIVSLIRMVEMYTNKTLDKGKVRTGNWEAIPLTQNQITYAANDAHCALMVYKRLLAIAAERKIDLVPSTYTCSVTCNSSNSTVSSAASTAADVAVSPSSSAKTSSTAQTVSRTSSSSSTYSFSRPLGYVTDVREPPRPQHMRAYNLWHNSNMPLQTICETLRSKENPLAQSTVISYVVWALQADPALPFSLERLKAFVQLEAGSWRRHRDWILHVDSRKH
ncbi:ribonuclease H-like domain-containing protein [Sparassis latifolia]